MAINTSLPKQRELPSISSERLPWAGLLALAMAGFICILTESLPAGLLPQIAKDLGVTESLTGQLVTLYAIGSLVAAIPLTAATRGWRRRPLLLVCIGGFLVFNTVTAISSDYILTLAARFMAGVSAGVLWGMTAGYARRMVPDSLKGKAMAVAMVGTPVALALGVPIGSFLSSYIGWRLIFGIVSLLTAALIVWVLWKMPDFAGEPAGERLPLHKVFLIPGVRPILFVVLAWMLAHNILYTYISPYLAQTVFANRVDLILLIFGITSIMGIWLTGMLIDRFLRRLVIISLAAFALASVVMGIGTHQPVMIIFGIMIWGITFGGAATLLQTAIAQAGGKSTDVAQSMLVTAWNLAIGGGGIIGGILLEVFGAGYLSGALFILLIPALLVVMRAYKYGFTRAN
ncbi:MULTISPECIES: MFS transporter [unclassified Paenibacillus]|uniref:MFS transporter n=1 Tax=unclassified Paenibacillus TaxID=185978 RepID=UPI000CFADC3A|nr:MULTISPECIES: MFS transporter [unclassified Paenibacillus]PRA05634.1 MFS transporter [Paenibacillus sp. MYb63]PRA50015.1 MFS transporter [Paenibacillus sp. MYb67]QZN75580.1 MFS transporter [Paenibacillus sp. DR312]